MSNKNNKPKGIPHYYATGYKSQQRAYEVLCHEISEGRLCEADARAESYKTQSGVRRWAIVEYLPDYGA